MMTGDVGSLSRERFEGVKGWIRKVDELGDSSASTVLSLDLPLRRQNKTYCRSPLRPTVGRRDDPQ